MPEKLDERFDVILVEDGSVLDTCKYFKFNLKSLLQDFEETQSKEHKYPITKELVKRRKEIFHRAFEELLLFCGDFFKQTEHEPTIPFKKMFSLDGGSIASLEDLKALCLE